MEDFLLELLIGFIQLVCEAILEIVGQAVLDLILRGLAKAFRTVTFHGPILAAMGFVLLGVLSGAISLLFFPTHFVRPARMHGISIVISPLIAGSVMALLGSLLRKQEKEVIQLETFRYGFAFALGVSVIRFFFAR